MPRMRWASRSGWNGSRPSVRSPVPMKLIGRPVTLRTEDNQGLEAQLVGVTKSVPGYDFKLLDNMMIFDPKVITNPAGVRSVEWLKTLKPEFVKMDVPTFKQ